MSYSPPLLPKKYIELSDGPLRGQGYTVPVSLDRLRLPLYEKLSPELEMPIVIYAFNYVTRKWEFKGYD